MSEKRDLDWLDANFKTIDQQLKEIREKVAATDKWLDEMLRKEDRSLSLAQRRVLRLAELTGHFDEILNMD